MGYLALRVGVGCITIEFQHTVREDAYESSFSKLLAYLWGKLLEAQRQTHLLNGSSQVQCDFILNLFVKRVKVKLSVYLQSYVVNKSLELTYEACKIYSI